jgi:hypothetical protein
MFRPLLVRQTFGGLSTVDFVEVVPPSVCSSFLSLKRNSERRCASNGHGFDRWHCKV